MLVTAGALALPGIAHAEGPPQPDQATTNDYLVALTMLYEATNQPRLGQALVGRVVINRAERMGAAHYESVVFPNGQFVAWTMGRKLAFQWCQIVEDGDPACFDRLAMERVCKYNTVDCEGRWGHFLDLARSLDEDPEGFEGVVNFDNPRFWAHTESGMPPWAPAKESLGCVGDHCFWR